MIHQHVIIVSVLFAIEKLNVLSKNMMRKKVLFFLQKAAALVTENINIETFLLCTMRFLGIYENLDNVYDSYDVASDMKTRRQTKNASQVGHLLCETTWFTKY